METKFAVGILSALGQETRLAIYRLLARQGSEGLAAGTIGGALSLAPATLSFHLRELAQAGLIRSRQQSRFIYYRADGVAMRDVLDYLAEIGRETVAASRALDPTTPRVALPIAPIAKPIVRPKLRSA